MRAPLLASQEENEWPREDHTNPFAHPERTGIMRVHQKSQDQPGAKVEPCRRATAPPDRRAHALSFRRRRAKHLLRGKTPSIADFWTNRGRRALHLGPAVTPARSLPSG